MKLKTACIPLMTLLSSITFAQTSTGEIPYPSVSQNNPNIIEPEQGFGGTSLKCWEPGPGVGANGKGSAYIMRIAGGRYTGDPGVSYRTMSLQFSRDESYTVNGPQGPFTRHEGNWGSPHSWSTRNGIVHDRKLNSDSWEIRYDRDVVVGFDIEDTALGQAPTGLTANVRRRTTYEPSFPFDIFVVRLSKSSGWVRGIAYLYNSDKVWDSQHKNWFDFKMETETPIKLLDCAAVRTH